MRTKAREIVQHTPPHLQSTRNLTRTVLEVEYMQGEQGWMKYPQRVLINGKEASLSQAVGFLLGIQNERVLPDASCFPNVRLPLE